MPLRFVTAMAFAALLGTLAEAKTVHIDIRELGFEPADASAEVGDTVEWSNADFVAHTATAGNGVFDVKIPPGATQSAKLDRAESIAYICRFRPTCAQRSQSTRDSRTRAKRRRPRPARHLLPPRGRSCPRCGLMGAGAAGELRFRHSPWHQRETAAVGRSSPSGSSSAAGI